MARHLVVCGTDCSQMETLATRLFVQGPDSDLGRALRQQLDPLDRINRRYLKKRNTRRLLQLLGNQFWTHPHRSALIFEVLQQRARQKAVRQLALAALSRAPSSAVMEARVPA
jgi:hypothetical protein